MIASFAFWVSVWTSALESLFNKVPGVKACNFIKERLQHRCFPPNIAKCLTPPVTTPENGWGISKNFSINFRKICTEVFIRDVYKKC